LLDAVRGASQTVTLPDGRAGQVTIPAGMEDGTVLRLADHAAQLLMR
jgi:hypothetical protein